jgi:hypothetical protein
MFGRLVSHSLVSLAHSQLENTELPQNNATPVSIGPDGIVRNGPFRICECSGSLFFGEDRIHCYDVPEPRFVGDLVVLCIWNDMIRIEDIQEVDVTIGGGDTAYRLIENGTPDILTHIHVKKDRLAAVVATTLDASWFPNNHTIGSVDVVVKADGVFGVSETQNPHRRYLRQERYLSDRNTKDGDDVLEEAPEWLPLGIGIFIGSAIFCLMCYCTGDTKSEEIDEGLRPGEILDFEKYVATLARGEAVTSWQGGHHQRTVMFVRTTQQSIAATEATRETRVTPDNDDNMSTICNVSA